MFRNKQGVPSDSASLKRDQARTVFLICIIFLAASFAIAAATIAWFVSGGRPSATGMSVRTELGIVDLRTRGGTGIHDDVLKKILADSYYAPENGSLDTGASRDCVNWLLSDDSKIGNYGKPPAGYASWEEFWEKNTANSQTTRRDYAIEPGSSGSLTFYVVPRYSGDVSLELELNIIPYHSSNGTLTEVSDSGSLFANGFLTGHILFFLETQDEQGTKTLQWLPDGRFAFTRENAQAELEYPVTLRWCWPRTFAELVLDLNDPFVYGAKSLFSDFPAVRADIVADMEANPGHHFYSNLTQKPLKSISAGTLSGLLGKRSDSDSNNAMTENQKKDFVEYSSFYNQADQHIGLNVSCIRIALTAE